MAHAYIHVRLLPRRMVRSIFFGLVGDPKILVREAPLSAPRLVGAGRYFLVAATTGCLAVHQANARLPNAAPTPITSKTAEVYQIATNHPASFLHVST